MSSPQSSPSAAKARRRRAGSIQQAIHRIETDPDHHLTGGFAHSQTPPTSEPVGRRRGKVKDARSTASSTASSTGVISKGLLGDVFSMNWTRVPSSALALMAVPVAGYYGWNLVRPDVDNPFKYFLFIQYPVGNSDTGETLYRKGYGDLAFLLYYVVVFSFIRQFITLHILRPLALHLRTREAKIDRFMEQGYAVIYFSTSSLLGLSAMYSMDTWYFEGRHFFQGYPYWKLTAFMKYYYLLQFSYWLQQSLILNLGLEKPRKDYKELVAHHIVTIWLIGWSYLTNMTPIGNAVFITMDFSDIFLSFSMILNYIKYEKTLAVSLAFFAVVWSYTRHYLNLYILWSIWKYFDLIPDAAQQWLPSEGVWMAPWVKWQIFVPLALLQGLNLFWFFLICRIIYRAIFNNKLADDRSDDEDDGQPDEPEKND